MKGTVLSVLFLFFLPALCLAAPAISFESPSYDFGVVGGQETVRHVLAFSNSGDQDLVIQKLSPSWGCTAALASSGRLGPGQQGRITVSVTLRGKTGNVSKTVQVYSNDPSRPVTTLSVRMYVKDSVHMKKYLPREIFNVRCRGCHVERGRGKLGKELFLSDCLMCHSDHMSAPSLAVLRGKRRGALADAVRDGIRGSSMPGWYTGNGGPLSEEDIGSLVDFMSAPNAP